MGIDVSFPDWLEKYGLLGALVFAALAGGAAIWWNALIGAIEAYQKQRRKRFKAVLFRPLATSLLFLIPLLFAIRIVSATKSDLRQAATLLDGRWRTGALGCEDARHFNVDPGLGVLVVRTRDGFRFLHDFEAMDPHSVQVRQRGASQPTIYAMHGRGLVERFLDGGQREMTRC